MKSTLDNFIRELRTLLVLQKAELLSLAKQEARGAVSFVGWSKNDLLLYVLEHYPYWE